jgi:hypothetical protein
VSEVCLLFETLRSEPLQQREMQKGMNCAEDPVLVTNTGATDLTFCSSGFSLQQINFNEVPQERFSLQTCVTNPRALIVE